MLVNPFKILKHITKSAFRRLNSSDSRISAGYITQFFVGGGILMIMDREDFTKVWKVGLRKQTFYGRTTVVQIVPERGQIFGQPEMKPDIRNFVNKN